MQPNTTEKFSKNDSSPMFSTAADFNAQCVESELKIKVSPLMLHTMAMDQYNDFLDLKDQIEESFINRDEVTLLQLENDYRNSMEYMSLNIYKMNKLHMSGKCNNKAEFKELHSEMSQWFKKMENHSHILSCYMESVTAQFDPRTQ